MLKSKLLDAIRTELRRHDLSHFQDDKIVQPGCPRCRKRFYTVPQFIDHLSDDVLPPLLDRLASNNQPASVKGALNEGKQETPSQEGQAHGK